MDTMSYSGDSEPRRYAVSFIRIDGLPKVTHVITNRGPLKAVYLAAATLRSASGKRALNIAVDDVGPVELDRHGTADLRGHVMDRNES
jgi:hypothetical protein